VGEPDPISVKIENNEGSPTKPRLNIGFRLKLGVITILVIIPRQIIRMLQQGWGLHSDKVKFIKGFALWGLLSFVLFTLAMSIDLFTTIFHKCLAAPPGLSRLDEIAWNNWLVFQIRYEGIKNKLRVTHL